MTNNFKTFLGCFLIPILLALEYFTGHHGFYNLAAFIIVTLTLIMAIIACAFIWIINTENFDPGKASMPDPINKRLITFSRTISVLTTIYLIWAGHLFIGFIDLVNLLLGIFILKLIEEFRKAIDEYKKHESPLAKIKRDLDEFEARKRTSEHL